MENDKAHFDKMKQKMNEDITRLEAEKRTMRLDFERKIATFTQDLANIREQIRDEPVTGKK